MAKIYCKCGHKFSISADNLPFVGLIIPDTEMENISNTLVETIDEFLEAKIPEKKIELVRKYFSDPTYSKNLKDSTIIHDILTLKFMKIGKDIFQCENCGRIIIENKKIGDVSFFKPEEEDSNGILS